MRSGGYTLHHSLTAEAAATVKQAVSLARRRGHAQVTPLHVASAMLASPAALLKRACLQSHSHPLQCKALELCFNVALNRLPTSAASPLLAPHSHLPSLSNALVAAFKRAQAHQRRGSIENQQQPILALKVEVEQLVISILDDPSVSRVMREAGFSSTQVKSNVEQAVSVEKCTSLSHSQAPPAAKETLPPPPSTNLSHFRSKAASHQVHSSDVVTVLEAMANKKTKNTVIVSECAAANESLVKKVIEKFDKKDVPHEMKSVQFISVPLFTLRNICKEEFEVKLGELRSLVKSYVGRGVVLYLGDLDWVSEFWCKHSEQRNAFYSHVEYMIMELSRLVCATEENHKRLWLMGIATFQTYAKCKGGRPSLETLWSLHPLTLPLGGLALGLTLHSGMHDRVKLEPVDDCSWLMGIKKQLVCCSDCEDNFKKEAHEAVRISHRDQVSSSSSSRLPSWLQQYKDENRKQLDNSQLQESDSIRDLCKKWNSICSSVHKKPHFLEKVFNLSSSSTSPCSSTSVSSGDRNKSKIQKSLLNWPATFEPSHETREGEVWKPSLEASKPELLSNPNSSPNSASSSEASEDMKLFDSENLAAALEEKVPWQKRIIPEIVKPILQHRLGTKMGVRRGSWLLFLGPDHNGKETMAKEMANILFGSHDEFVRLSYRRKRGRDDNGGSVYQRFSEAVHDNPSRVFYIEDVDRLDSHCLKGFERAMGDGSGSAPPLKDAIVIFSCNCESRASLADHGKSEKEDDDHDDDDEEKQCRALDLNVATEDGDEACGMGMLDSVDMQVVFRIHSDDVN